MPRPSHHGLHQNIAIVRLYAATHQYALNTIAGDELPFRARNCTRIGKALVTLQVGRMGGTVVASQVFRSPDDNRPAGSQLPCHIVCAISFTPRCASRRAIRRVTAEWAKSLWSAALPKLLSSATRMNKRMASNRSIIVIIAINNSRSPAVRLERPAVECRSSQCYRRPSGPHRKKELL
jgi:hypothetical protein